MAGVEPLQMLLRARKDCKLTPPALKKLINKIGRRVLLHGTIHFAESGLTTRIQVDTWTLLDDHKIPSLEELHAIGINITGNADAADYIARLRGELG